MPPSLMAAIPAISVEVFPYRISRRLCGPVGARFEQADELARAMGYSLPSEVEWEVAELLTEGGLSEPNEDEWCLDWFDWNRGDLIDGINPVIYGAARLPLGAPPYRKVIRGRSIDIFHTAMRFHGGYRNLPYSTTGSRWVQRSKPLCCLGPFSEAQ